MNLSLPGNIKAKQFCALAFSRTQLNITIASLANNKMENKYSEM